MPIEIYVTDDDADFRALVAQALGQKGYKVQLCASSTDLVAALEASNDPAIVLLDIYMDGHDGFSAIEQLRAVQRPFRLRFVTGGDVATADAACLVAKARDFDVGETLFKPFPLDHVIQAISEDIQQMTA